MLMDLEMNKMFLCLITVQFMKFLYFLFYSPLQISSLIHLLLLILQSLFFALFHLVTQLWIFCLKKNVVKSPLCLVFIFDNLDN